MNNYPDPIVPKIVGTPAPDAQKTYPSGAPSSDIAKFGTPQAKEQVKAWKPLGRKG